MRKTMKITAITFVVTSLALVATVYPYGQLNDTNGSGIVTGDHWELGQALPNRSPGDGRTVIVHFGTNATANYKAAVMISHDRWESIVALDFDDSPVFTPGGANLGDGYNTHQFNVNLGGGGVLAVTPSITDANTGQILEADVFYGHTVRWDTTGNPNPNETDLDSVAFHELGHFIGLSHSGEVDATMFPFIQSGTESASSEPDDEISATRVYAQDPGDVNVPTGGISGRIIDGNNANDGKVCGVVYAFSTSEAPITLFAQAYAQTYSGSVVGVSAVNNTSGPNSGSFQIDGLPDDDYFVLLDTTGNVINANQISNYCIDFGEAGFSQEWWNGIAESNAEGCLGCAVAVTVSGGAITSGIDMVTQTGTCSITENPEVSCADGVDNDCDGFADGEDDGCQGGGGCTVPADCDDGVACTDDDCVSGSCVNTPNNANCPDDGQFCNGTEFCHSTNGCSSTGDPCAGNETCNETTDTCDQQICGGNKAPCSVNEDCCSLNCKNGSCKGN